MRILAGHSHSSKQQVIRIDYEGASLNNEEIREAILDRLERAVPAAKAVVMSDYNYGVVDSRAADLIRRTATVPVLVDSRFRLRMKLRTLRALLFQQWKSSSEPRVS